MDQYKYTLETAYLNTDKSTTTAIDNANIKSIVIDRDYDNYHMPMIFMTLTLDKNLIDDMVKNTNTYLINMTIYKFVEGATPKIKTAYVTGQFSYFIHTDINYNKDMDYADGNADRTDIYKTICIGMMHKTSIDNNKKTFNSTIKNTTMINVINMCTKHMPVLIEPLTYNKSIPQLIIPPQDSVWKSLQFLNSIAVFYDTHYRFFIDFDTTYIISSSGTPTPRKGEKYSTVMINMHTVSDYAANTVGMTEDAVNKYYVIEMNTVDTNYHANNYNDKSFNSVTAVLDTSKSKSVSNVTTIKKAKLDAAGYIDLINSAIKGKINILKGTHDTSRDTGHSLKSNATILNTNVTALITELTTVNAIIVAFPTIPSETDITSNNYIIIALIHKILIEIAKYIATATTAQASIPSTMVNYNTMHSNIGTNIDSTIEMLSYINGVTDANLKDNLPYMQSLSTHNAASINSSMNFASTAMAPLASNVAATQTASGVVTDIDTLSKMIVTPIAPVVPASGSSTSTPVIVAPVADLSILKPYVIILQGLQATVNSTATLMNADIATASVLPSKLSSVNNSVIPTLTGIGTLPSGLNSSNVFSTTTSTATTSKASIINIIGLTSLISGSVGDFNPNLINQILSNLDGVKDMSSISGSGASKVNVNLNLSNNTTATNKQRLVRVNNDNVNIVKNMKSQAELETTKLSLNKNDLDASVLTINKQYIIKNINDHSDKDGKFLLSRKRELFIRQDDSFVMNTMLDFKRLSNTTS